MFFCYLEAKMKGISKFVVCIAWCIASVAALPESEIQSIRHKWAVAKYHQKDLEQDASFKDLLRYTKTKLDEHPDDAALWAWHGTIMSTYASVKGGVGALQTLSDAKDALERSIELDPTIEHGLAHSTLGALYYRVPAWPVSFKDKKKAEYHLSKALDIDPNNIDANYFMGEYYRRLGKSKKAAYHLTRASNVPKSNKEGVAEAGRRQEVATSLASIQR